MVTKIKYFIIGLILAASTAYAVVELDGDSNGAVDLTLGGTNATTATAARINLGVDPAGTDNSTDVTLSGTPDYITIIGQEITRNLIDLTTDITGTLPGSNLADNTVGSAKMSVSANVKSLLDAATFQTIAELLETQNWDFTGNNTYGAVTAMHLKNAVSDTYYGAFNIPTFSANRQIYFHDENMRIPASDQTNSSGQVIFPVEIGLACSDETTDLTTGTAKVTFRAPYAFTLTEVRANVNTAPVGSTLNVDINESGVSVLSTVITIDASEETSTTAATAAVISDSAIADDAEITIDIDQIGSTTAGKGLKIWLIGTRTL